MLVPLIILVFVSLFLTSFFLPEKVEHIHGSATFETSPRLSRWNRGLKIGDKSLSLKDSFNHACLLGPSGSNKTQYLIAPNVFHLAKSSSLIITDPKLELYQITSGYFKEKMGLDVYVINLESVEKSLGWNPFYGIKYKDIQGLVAKLYDIVQTSKEAESIWKYGAIEYLTIVCQVLFYYQNQKFLNLANLIYVLNELQADEQTVLNWLYNNTQDQRTRQSIRRIHKMEDKIKSGMLTGAIATLIPYSSEEVLHISGHHSFPELSSFRRKRSILYIALPIGADERFIPYLTLLTSSLFSQIIQDKHSFQGHPITCILEEFGNLLAIPDYPSIVSTIRSKRVCLFHCLQNLEQLRHLYGTNGADIIANNCSHWIILAGIKSKDSLTWITESLLGLTTAIEKDNFTNQKHIVSRPLLQADEVRRLKKGTGILVSGADQPSIISFKPLYKFWFLNFRFGLKSIRGHLLSRYKPVEHNSCIEKIEYVSLNNSDTSLEGNEVQESLDQMTFDSLIKKHFG